MSSNLERALIDEGYTQQEAAKAVRDAKRLVADGASAEDILLEAFGLDPEYVDDLY